MEQLPARPFERALDAPQSVQMHRPWLPRGNSSLLAATWLSRLSSTAERHTLLWRGGSDTLKYIRPVAPGLTMPFI